METIKIEPKLIDINSETYWGMVDRLYAQCERAMDNGFIEENRAGSFEDFFPKLVQLQVPVLDGTSIDDLIKLFYVAQMSLEISLDREKSSEQEVVDLEKQVKKIQKELENEVRNHEDTKSIREQHTSTISTLERNVRESNEKIKRLQIEVNELNIQNKDLDLRLKTDLDQNVKSKKGIERAQEERQNLLYEIKSLDEKLRNTLKTNDKKTKDMEDMNTKITNYERDLQESKILTREMSRANKKLEEEIAVLTATITELEKEKQSITSSVQKKVKTLEEHTSNSTNEIKELQTYIAQTERNLNIEREKYEKLQLLTSDNESRITELEDKIYQKESIIYKLESEIDELQQQQQVANQGIINNSEGTSEEATNQIASYQDQIRKLSTQLQNISSKLDESVSDNSRKTKTIDELTKCVSDRENELATVKAKLREYEKGVSGLDQALKEIRYLREQISLRDKDIEEYKLKLNHFMMGLQEHQEENKYLRNRLGIPMSENLKKYALKNFADVQLQTDFIPPEKTIVKEVVVKEVVKEVPVVKYIQMEQPTKENATTTTTNKAVQVQITTNPTITKIVETISPRNETRDALSQTENNSRNSQTQTLILNENTNKELVDNLRRQIANLQDEKQNNEALELRKILLEREEYHKNIITKLNALHDEEQNNEALELRKTLLEREEYHKNIITKLNAVHDEKINNDSLEFRKILLEREEYCKNIVTKLNAVHDEKQNNMALEHRKIILEREEYHKNILSKLNVLHNEKKQLDLLISQLQSSNLEKDTQLAKLQHGLDSYRVTLKSIERTLEEKIDTIEELTRAKIKLENKIKGLESKLTETEDKLDAFSDNDRMQLEKEAIIENLILDKEQIIHEHEVDLESINRFSDNMKKTIENLNEMLDQKETTIREYENKINQIREEHMKDKLESQQEISRLQSRLNNENSDLLQNLKQNIKMIENQDDPQISPEAGVRIEEVEEMIAAKTNDIKKLTSRITGLENILKDKDVMLHEAMKTFDEMKLKLDQEIEEHKQAAEEMHVQLLSERNECQKLKRQLSEHALKKQLALQEKKAEKLSKQRDHLEQTVQTLSNKLLKAEEKILAFDVHKTNIDKFEVERSEEILNKDRQEWTKKLEDLSNELTVVKNGRQEKANKIIDLQKEIQTHIKAKKSLKSEIDKLQKENEELAKSKTGFHEDKKNHQQQITKLMKKYNDLQEEKSRISDELGNVKKELASNTNDKEIEKRHAIEKVRVEYQKTIVNVNSEIDRVKKEKEVLELETKESKEFLEKKQQEMYNNISKALKEKDEALKEKNKLIGETKELRKENEELKNALTTLQQEVTEIGKEKDLEKKRAVEKVKQDYQKQLVATNSEMEKMKKEKETSEQEELKSSSKLKSQQFIERKQQEMSLNLSKALREKEEAIKERNTLFNEAKVLRRENEELKNELNAFDPEFFEDIEDLKYNYVQALEENKLFRKKLQELNVSIEEDYPKKRGK